MTPGHPPTILVGPIALTFAIFWFIVVLTLHLWRGRIGEPDELRITALAMVAVPVLALLSAIAVVGFLGSVITSGVVATLAVANSLILLGSIATVWTLASSGVEAAAILSVALLLAVAVSVGAIARARAATRSATQRSHILEPQSPVPRSVTVALAAAPPIAGASLLAFVPGSLREVGPIVVGSLGLTAVGYWLWWRFGDRLPRASWTRSVVADGLALLIITAATVDPRFRADPTHSGFYLAPLNDYLHGKTPLVDLNTLYGVAMVPLLGGFFQVLPLPFAPSGLAALNGAFTIVEIWSIYLIARVALGSPFAALTAMLLFFIASFYGPVRVWASLLTLPNSGPFRFVFPYVLIALALLARPADSSARLPRLAGLAILGLASIWGLESFSFTATAYAAFVLYERAVSPLSLQARFVRLVQDAVGCVAAIAVAQAAFAAYVLVRSGQTPSYDMYSQYFGSSAFAQAALYAIPIAPWSPWAPVAAIYVCSVLGLLSRALWDVERASLPSSRAAAGLTAIGIASLSYYLVRSNSTNLTVICGPAVLLACYWLRELAISRGLPTGLRHGAVFTLAAGLVVLAGYGAPNAINLASETLAGEAVQSFWQREMTPGLRAFLTPGRTLRGGWPEGVEAQAAFVRQHRGGQARVSLLAEGTRTTNILASAGATQKLPFSHPYLEIQTPSTLRLGPSFPSLLDVGDRVFVRLAELQPFQIQMLVGLCDRFALAHLADGPDGIVAFELQPHGRPSWSWCEEPALLVTELVREVGGGRGPVVVMGDWWISSWAQRYATSVAPIFTVPLPGLSDDEIVRQLMYDTGLLGGVPIVVRMEGGSNPYTSYLRTICLEVGLDVVATSREDLLVLRASGNPGLAGEFCKRLVPPLTRDAAGTVFAISPGELRRPVIGATTLARLAANETPVEPRPATDAELALPIGDPIEANHPAWRFVRGATGPVYLLDNWQRREVRDEQSFIALGGLGDRSNVLVVSDVQLGLIPLGEPAPSSRRDRRR